MTKPTAPLPGEGGLPDICVMVSGGMDSGVLLAEVLYSLKFKSVYPVYVRSGLRWEAAESFWLERFLSGLEASMEADLKKRLRPLTILESPTSDLYGIHWSLQGNGGVPDASSRDEEVYLPGRNLMLLSKAAVFCRLHGIDRIAVGLLRGNPFPDATEAFIKSMERTIALSLNRSIRLLTPFLTLSKTDVLRRSRQLRVPLEFTFSCLQPSPLHEPCGRCNKCAERDRAAAWLQSNEELPSSPPLLDHI